MSEKITFDTDPTCQTRRNRIYSVGLPPQSILLPDPSTLGKNVPVIPRRHSVAPMVSASPISLRPPAIPKRSKNERPIPIFNPTSNKFNPTKSQDSTNQPCPSNFAQNPTYSAWNQLGNDQLNVNSATKDEGFPSNCASPFGDFATFDQMRYDAASTCVNAKTQLSDFERSVKVPRNSNRRLNEGDDNGTTSSRSFQDPKRCSDSANQPENQNIHLQQSSSKFAELQKSSHELENRLQERPDNPGKSVDDQPRKMSNCRQETAEVNKRKKIPKATQTNLPPPLSAVCPNSGAKPTNVRQDSNISSDSYSQTSSPSYTNKTMEAPLLPQKFRHDKVLDNAKRREPKLPTSPIIKSMSTPASLQAIVKFHSGSNMSLHNRIIRDIRRPSSHFVTKRSLQFRFALILINAIALVIITGFLAAYVRSYPENAVNIKNRTLYTDIIDKLSFASEPIFADSKNPSPGVCLPVIVSFCQRHKIPYNFTVFPNYMGNFGQHEAQHELQQYDAVVEVKCYELAALFLCSIFAPKCGSNGHVVPPCRSLCYQTMRRCGFFLEIFGLSLPDYLKCDLFNENANPDVCVGHREVIEAAERASKPVCKNGFQCDNNRCIPTDWRCDGHVDCEDKTDETKCSECENDAEHLTLCKEKSQNETKASVSNWHCGNTKCLSPKIVCDGVVDCPWGQDERNCLKLSERNGDIASGRLEVYQAENNTYVPACITSWDEGRSAQALCSHLGYASVVSSTLSMKNNSTSLIKPARSQSLHQGGKSDQKSMKSLLKSFQSCSNQSNYRTVDLVCSEYVCGQRRYSYRNAKLRTRIVGGVEASPGDWPFLAALLGGPEEVFYCAGVLISDQWLLTASHCAGNYSNVSGWTIQLGITRRNSHSYLGQKLKVKRVVPHPNYNLGIAHDNDVALFQLVHKVEFHEHLKPVCLPKANEEIQPQTVCTVIGWGKKNDTESSEYEFAINEVEVPVLPRDICNSWLEHKDLNVTDGMICAGYAGGEKDACQGDSGGPLLCRDKHDRDKWFVGGIVSWGIKCAYPKLPGVYAYVPKYVPWIQQEIAKYSDDR